MNHQYDIFISYRRTDTGDKAEHLKDLLEPRYKNRVSFDRENLTGLFDVSLIQRIDQCKDFLLIVGKNSFSFNEKDFAPDKVELYKYLARCTQKDFEAKIIELGHDVQLDFVRIEIGRALNREGLNIIPIVPESTTDFNFSKLHLPPDIAGIKRYESFFYSDNPDALFKDVVPKFEPHLRSRADVPLKRFLMPLAILLLALLVGAGIYYGYNQWEEREKRELMVNTALDGKYLSWSETITIEQLKAIRGILENMVKVDGGSFMMGALHNQDGTYEDDVDVDLETPAHEQSVGTFWMGKYEVTVAEWHRVMGTQYNEAKADYPITNVSYEECLDFVGKLADLTNLDFQLPTEMEWEYAARGGNQYEGTKYAGSDNPDEVAWYAGNSADKAHVCDAAHSPMTCNALNLYDMSGNVSEWCDTQFTPYDSNVPTIDEEAKVIRGGNYMSPAYGVTVYHREPMNKSNKAMTVGLRIIVRN